MLLCLAAPFAVQLCAAQPHDTPGCKDSPLINRFPGSVIDGCVDKPDDSHSFPDIGPKKEPKKLEGEYHFTQYDFPKGATAAQVVRNLMTALRTAGHTLVQDDTWGDFTLSSTS